MSDAVIVVRLLTSAQTAEAKVSSDAVDVLEELLAQAREGRVGQMVVVYEQDAVRYESAWTGTRDIAQRLGMLDIARHRLLSGD